MEGKSNGSNLQVLDCDDTLTHLAAFPVTTAQTDNRDGSPLGPPRMGREGFGRGRSPGLR